MKNWLVVSNIFYFHPYLGKWSILTNIFQRGWNHQLEKVAKKAGGTLSQKISCLLSAGEVWQRLQDAQWQWRSGFWQIFFAAKTSLTKTCFFCFFWWGVLGERLMNFDSWWHFFLVLLIFFVNQDVFLSYSGAFETTFIEIDLLKSFQMNVLKYFQIM